MAGGGGGPMGAAPSGATPSNTQAPMLRAPNTPNSAFGRGVQNATFGVANNFLRAFSPPQSAQPVQPTQPVQPPPPWQAQLDRTAMEQAYTQQFRPGPTGQPFNPNPTPAPTTGPQGQALITVGGQQGYYRNATADEIRRATAHSGNFGYSQTFPVEGYNARTRQVFIPYTPPTAQNTQSQQFFQPIYLSRYQNYQPQGFQGPFGGQMNPYSGFHPFMSFDGMGGMYGGGRMYAYANGGDVDTGIAGLLNG